VTIRVFQGEREMASDNKLLGQFDLVGIPPAPRGVPQVEVTFDIDANGIVHVHAKDLGTGKEQSIQITASSGLSKEEVDKMVREAQAHADEDKKKREVVDARNQLDGLVYQTEKTLGEHGTSLDAAARTEVEQAISEAKQALESQDADRMRRAADALSRASHKLAEAMYSKASQGQPGAQPGGTAGQGDGGAGPQGEGKPKEDVVEAEFEEVKE
jgi:molecular chaperone DnaK